VSFLESSSGIGAVPNSSPSICDRGDWKDNINIDLGVIGYGDGRWMKVAQDCDLWQDLVHT
jgi:hypothetical protein